MPIETNADRFSFCIPGQYINEEYEAVSNKENMIPLVEYENDDKANESGECL